MKLIFFSERQRCNGNDNGNAGGCYLGGAASGGEVAVEAVLVEDPLGLLAARGAALVEDERLLHADERAAAGGGGGHLPVLAGGRPVAGAGEHLGGEVVGDELLVGGVEPEPRRQPVLAGRRRRRRHLLPQHLPQRVPHGGRVMMHL